MNKKNSLYNIHDQLIQMKNNGTLLPYITMHTFMAKFIRIGNIVSEEPCLIYNTCTEENKNVAALKIIIGDGNHSTDFDEVQIMSDDNLVILRLFHTNDMYIKGYGTMELHNLII